MVGATDRFTGATKADHHWALVLAAGAGKRLRSLTTTPSGLSVPKQFCSLSGGPSLLYDALSRAAVVAPLERTCVVVARQHEHWWQNLSQSIPVQNIVVQPRNCGTAMGILLPLLLILHRDPQALLVVLPSDHFVRNESVLMASLHEAVQQVETDRDHVVLLGLIPEEPDPDLGYIVPHGAAGPGPRGVAEFVEKPSPDAARALIERGGFWNSFIFAASGQTLLRAFEDQCPGLVIEMRGVMCMDDPRRARAALDRLYERLGTMDFSRDIVERRTSLLRVLAVPACGWSDLGTPGRVTKALARDGQAPRVRGASGHSSGFLDLAAACSQVHMC